MFLSRLQDVVYRIEGFSGKLRRNSQGKWPVPRHGPGAGSEMYRAEGDEYTERSILSYPASVRGSRRIP